MWEPKACFNPLDRGNLNQISQCWLWDKVRSEHTQFQSPRSGKFESNRTQSAGYETVPTPFQSPRSGKFESNRERDTEYGEDEEWFQSPRSGKFESN